MPSGENTELGNCFVKGTQGLPVAGDQERGFLKVPVNTDHVFPGVIESYDAGKVVATSLWDLSVTKKEFICQAQYLGRIGTPTEDECEIGTICMVARTGIGNNDYSGSGYQLYDESNTSDISFIAFIMAVPS